jgi:FMN phosphatase YigB (HAD superfamily)
MASSIPPSRGIQRAITKPVITFDAGQTLVELDLDFLARRLSERGVVVGRDALGAAAPAAWARYDQLVAAGQGHPWQALMHELLTGAQVPDPAPHVAWLWSQQPTANLWRKPIPEMIDLARELADRGAIVGVLSNSEGRLAELFEEIGIARAFVAIVDSGRVGIEKPDPRIFAHTLEVLGSPGPGIHIGDSWAADIVGARGVGWRAIWFGPKTHAVDDDGVAVARDAAEARAALVKFGVL